MSQQECAPEALGLPFKGHKVLRIVLYSILAYTLYRTKRLAQRKLLICITVLQYCIPWLVRGSAQGCGRD